MCQYDEEINPRGYLKGLPSYKKSLKTRVESENDPVDLHDCVECAILCAEELLEKLNERYPADKRHANTVLAARAWLENQTINNQQSPQEAMDNADLARRAAEAAWLVAKATYWAAKVKVEENAEARARDEATEANSKRTRSLDKSEGCAREVERLEQDLSNARRETQAAKIGLKQAEENKDRAQYEASPSQNTADNADLTDRILSAQSRFSGAKNNLSECEDRERQLNEELIQMRVRMQRAQTDAEQYNQELNNLNTEVENATGRRNESMQNVRTAARDAVRLTR